MDGKEFCKVKVELESGVNIICFGAGRGFKRFVQESKNMFESKIQYVVDNDKEKVGKILEIQGEKYSIKSVENLFTEKMPYILIMTCVDFASIEKQIKELNKDLKIYRYIDLIEGYYVWRAENVYIPDSVRVYDKPLIPKVIHYCWFGKNPIPAKYCKWIESWKKFCPDYEIIEWNEKNYDVHKIKYISQAYNAEKWAFVSDYARLDIIYKHGGIYLDVDVELLKSLDELLYAKGFMGFELYNYIDSGLGFGAVKNLPVIGEMRSVYDDVEFFDFVDRSDYEVKRRAGEMKLCTDYQTEVLKGHGLIADSFQYQKIADLQIYPVPVLCGKVQTKYVITKNTYSIHHYAASWLK